jgi:hypothetical protein
MLDKKLSEITPADLQQLIAEQIRESKFIEYKKELPDKMDSSKISFLAGISAFANSSGGTLIYGIEAKDGIPKCLIGFPRGTIEKDVLRIDQMIKSGISPKIPSCEIRAVDINDNNSIVIIKVEKSWLSPHIVSYNEHCKFYGRTSAGKYQLDIDEIKQSFLLGEQIPERIRKFRIERIINIQSNSTSVNVNSGAKLVIHVIPLEGFTRPFNINLEVASKSENMLAPIGASGWNNRINLDGIIQYTPLSDSFCDSYTQLYRSGSVEALYVFNRQEKYLPSTAYERYVIKALKEYFPKLLNMGISFPMYVFISLLGLKGYRLAVSNHEMYMYSNSSDDVILPEVICESTSQDISIILRPVFDMVWNAFGLIRSFNYDENGSWRAFR